MAPRVVVEGRSSSTSGVVVVGAYVTFGVEGYVG